jgi:hypothetical protein
MTLKPADPASQLDGGLLVWLLGKPHRPNLLVECSADHLGPVVGQLLRSGAAPARRCALPGELRLPEAPGGTLVLENATALTLVQQRALHEWLGRCHGSVQVVSVVTEPALEAVRRGRFLEDLYYRLNVVRMDVPGTPGSSTRAH